MSAKTLNVRDLIPQFELPAVNRSKPIGPWDYKQNQHLVLLFLHGWDCGPCQQLVQDLAKNYSAYRTAETEVLVLFPESLTDLKENLNQQADRDPIPFPVLSDEVGKARSRYFSGDQSDSAHPVGLFICDRFGELYHKTLADEADQLLSEPEIRDWVTFIDMRCPECFPPEW